MLAVIDHGQKEECKTRRYPWGIQSPHTSTARGGGFWVSSDLNSRKKVRVYSLGCVGCSWVSSDLNSRKKFRVFHWGAGGGVFG